MRRVLLPLTPAKWLVLLVPLSVLLMLARVGAAQAPVLTLDTPDAAPYDSFGSSVAVGDVNGDGQKEIVVGAPGFGSTDVANEGKVYVFSADGALLFSLTSPNHEYGGHFFRVALGDVNGDGTDEIVVGAYGENNYSGRVYVFSGIDRSLLMTLESPHPQADAYFGRSVAAGDVNGDGEADILVGAEYENVGINQWQGEAYLFSGADGSPLLTLDSANPTADGEFGTSVAIGDIDGDGRGEMVVGAPSENQDGEDYEGRAYIFASDGSLMARLGPPGSAWFGSALAVGDVNGDGEREIVIGAPGETANGNFLQGRVYVFSGRNYGVLAAIDRPGAGPWAQFGKSLAVGDVNGDGIPDLAVGAVEGRNASIGQGRVYGFSGADGSLLFALDPPDPSDYAAFGSSLAVSDINGDGKDDVVAGAPGENIGSNADQGRVYAFSNPLIPTPIPTPAPTPTLTPGVVGGVAEPPDTMMPAGTSRDLPYATFAGVAAVAVALAAGGWFVRRRRAR